MNENFSANLSLLCSYRPSIAETCRKIGLNRPQFNKYLSGQTFPSRHNMRRICDFFGVTDSEILMESPQFEQMIIVRRTPDMMNDLDLPLQYLDRIYRESQSLEKYVGFYYRYFFSFGNKGLITRSLASIHQRKDKYYWKNIEVLRDPDSGKILGLNKYEGAVFYLTDRIYVMEFETLGVRSITQMTLYPSHRHRLDRLLGIQTGGPTRRGRKPGASKVALDFLGQRVDLRKALARTGFFHPDAEGISGKLVEQITNTIADDSCVLDVDEP